MKRGRTASLSLLLRLWLIGCWLLPATCDAFTVILSDSNAPATLLDTPQTGILMKNGGGRQRLSHHHPGRLQRPLARHRVHARPRRGLPRRLTVLRLPLRRHRIPHLRPRQLLPLPFPRPPPPPPLPLLLPLLPLQSPAPPGLPRPARPHPPLPRPPRKRPRRRHPLELANLTHLRVLDLHSNRLSSSIPPSLSALSRLRSLDLSGNRLTGPIPDLPTDSLDVLDLSGNLLDGPFPLSLCKAQRLIKMDLSWNRLAGPIPDSLSGLKSLMLLDLSRNLLTGPLPASIGSLESLRSLVLEGNPMHSAQIPPDVFSQLENLTVLVLSNMGLCGPIPESIAQLPALRVLHLDRNRLNGTIPEGFRNLRKISELRLDNNQLVGAIPFDRETLWRMRWKLRLSNNSGLCHEAGGGDVPFLLGVQSCPAVEDGLAVSTTTQHDVSSLDLRHSMSGGGPMHYVAVSRTNAGSHCRLPASAFYCLVLLWFLTL